MEEVHFTTLLICKQQVLSISFSFSRFRCSCSWTSHSKNVGLFVKLEKTAFLSLAEKEEDNRVLLFSKSSFVLFCWISIVCLIATNFNHSANPIAREFYPVWQMQKITLFFLSFSSFTNCCEQADFKPLSTFLLFNNHNIKKKKQNKTNSKHSL